MPQLQPKHLDREPHPCWEESKALDPESLSSPGKASPDAIAYGVWDGDRLLGHVKGTSFQGVLGAGSSAALRIDAVRKDGSRTPLTGPVGLRLGEQGIEVSKSDAAPGAAADPAGAAASQGAQPAAGEAPATQAPTSGTPTGNQPAAAKVSRPRRRRRHRPRHSRLL